jgi:hypothetical protein
MIPDTFLSFISGGRGPMDSTKWVTHWQSESSLKIAHFGGLYEKRKEQAALREELVADSVLVVFLLTIAQITYM